MTKNIQKTEAYLLWRIHLFLYAFSSDLYCFAIGIIIGMQNTIEGILVMSILYLLNTFCFAQKYKEVRKKMWGIPEDEP